MDRKGGKKNKSTGGERTQGTGFVIAADDGGLYEISEDDLLRAARKVEQDDPGYRTLQDAAESGLRSAILKPSGDNPSKTFFVCKTFSQCSNSKNYFINVRSGASSCDDDGSSEDDDS